MLAAEEAGAVAAIIVNSEHTMMPMGEDERYNPTIPSIHIPLAAGQALRNALAGSSSGLWGTLRALPGQQASAGPKPSPATVASAAAPVGRPAAGSQPLNEIQVASSSRDQCGESTESVREHELHERTEEVSVDDYYSPEEDTEEEGEREGPAGEGSCPLDSSVLSASAADWGPAHAPPPPEHCAEEQGTHTQIPVISPSMAVPEGVCCKQFTVRRPADGGRAIPAAVEAWHLRAKD